MKKTVTRSLAEKTWNSAEYYHQARAASEDAHPALIFLRNRYQEKSVLEIGCGEGTKLAGLDAERKTGIDISPVAVRDAKKKIDEAVVGDAESLPFGDSTFDAAVSFFSLEHCESPEKVLAEMVRVTRSGGEIVVLTPNFGAPNRQSPCFTGSRIHKLAGGFFADFFPSRSLGWNHVTPLSLTKEYESDYDTVVEPYALSLIRYLKSQGLEIVHNDTHWDVPVGAENVMQRFFHTAASLRIFPFIYWGPHAFVIARVKK